MNDYFEIGKIVNTVGIRGEIKVYPTTDDIKRFELLDTLTVLQNEKRLTLPIKAVRYHRNLVMLQLEGIDCVDSANALRGGIIVVDRANALPLSPGEHYVRDLIGLNVLDLEGEHLGVLADVLFTGANDVYVVKSDGKKDLLIPAIKECIISVDIDNGQIIVKLLEGLRDL